MRLERARIEVAQQLDSQQLLGGKRSHERTKTNSRCHHQEEVLVLEGHRQAAISLFNELSAFSGTQEFLEVVRSLPRGRREARAQRGVGLLAAVQ